MRRGLLAIGALAVAAWLAPLLAPYDPDQILDVVTARDLPPGTTRDFFHLRDGRTVGGESYRLEGSTLRLQRPAGAIEIPLGDLSSRRPESRRFLLGTDAFGRDLLSRLLHGARVSLLAGLLAVAIGVSVGAIGGGVAGYFGGPVDSALMRLVDVMQAIPRLFLFLVCAALFGSSFPLLVVVLGATGWMPVARMVRGQVLSVRSRRFVEAARALGCGTPRLLGRHVLPQCSGVIAVSAALLAADAILAESSLSFIGLGIRPPAASWGSLVAAGRETLLDAWWVSLFPGLAIVGTVMLLQAAGTRLARSLSE